MDGHDERRAAAIGRIKRRRDLKQHAVVYATVNALLIVIWAASGAGYFWPIWPMIGWGLALALQAWSIYGQQPITEDEILEETRRRSGSG